VFTPAWTLSPAADNGKLAGLWAGGPGVEAVGFFDGADFAECKSWDSEGVSGMGGFMDILLSLLTQLFFGFISSFVASMLGVNAG
jgi:hypothetical protein